MPTPFLKKLSKEKNIPVSTLEKYWDEAKKITENKFKISESKFSGKQWGYVTAIVKNKASKKSKDKDFSDNLGRWIASQILTIGSEYGR